MVSGNAAVELLSLQSEGHWQMNVEPSMHQWSGTRHSDMFYSPPFHLMSA